MNKEKTTEMNSEEVNKETEELKENIEDKVDESATEETTPENGEEESLVNELSEAKNKYLRLYSEFENFRRRTSKEKLEMISTANESLLQDLLPVIDDFNRAKILEKVSTDTKSTEGFLLIENKFMKVLEKHGVKQMGVKQGDKFDSDLHEAVSQIPAPKKKLKEKIVDTIEDGYYLGEKVIRFAKVVIGK